MKLFTRTLLTAVALSFAVVPMAQAQQQHRQDRKPGHSYVVKKKEVTTRHSWRKGERYSNWKGRPAVRDYHRYGLRKPARGQQWVKVDNSYLLMSVATGLILGVAAAR
ncbi:RcnB family protein [Shinella sp. CPCC 101442]|uniref:RcnB family protein n=1 Tax=Shinella sp. CPCC 101442 TaxID=2932265 RepID=UPI00215224A7|nr:RcnB family protein [Shinella sp. CPCC 101442]MCR6501791.1 RcnB family protein [Shinella sp. CPCC 101442]